jgi:nitrous oxidase accessory protein
VRADASRWAAGGRGNHWGDYTGFDASSDGIGDIPYRRTDLLEHLADRAPALQVFLFTPAHLALETAARVMPLVRADPIVEDPAPLMRPPAGVLEQPALTAGGGAPAGSGLGLSWVGLALVLPALAGVFSLRPARPRS